MASGCTVPVDALIVRFRANAKRAAARPQQQRNAVMRGSPSVPCLFPASAPFTPRLNPGSLSAFSRTLPKFPGDLQRDCSLACLLWVGSPRVCPLTDGAHRLCTTLSAAADQNSITHQQSSFTTTSLFLPHSYIPLSSSFHPHRTSALHFLSTLEHYIQSTNTRDHLNTSPTPDPVCP